MSAPGCRRQLNIAPAHVLITASHCHGKVCADVAQRTIQAVTEAWRGMVSVDVGVGRGREDRIMENRRLTLKSGKEADVRHAYALPPDDEVVGVGPVDPQIGILRLDRKDGPTLALVYNFRVPSDPGRAERRQHRGHRGFRLGGDRRRAGRRRRGPLPAGLRRRRQSGPGTRMSTIRATRSRWATCSA